MPRISTGYACKFFPFSLLCHRASELLLSTTKHARAHTTSTFHTSTPARPRPSQDSPPADSDVSTEHDTTQHHTASILPIHPHAPPLRAESSEERQREVELETIDADYIAAARAMFDAKEFSRVAHWLQDCQSAKAKFLRIYSEYMVRNSTNR